MPLPRFKKRGSTNAASANATGTATRTTAASDSGSSTASFSSRGSSGWSPRPYSNCSTVSIPDSCFWTQDFVLGASMVVIQPSSGKVVVVNNTARRSWFLPRGRKDIGESLEQCALREAYEETGYRVGFLPLHLPLRAPAPPNRPDLRREPTISEPVFITTNDFGPYRRRGNNVDPGGQYVTFYYAGQIPANAVREESTGMPDEKHYVGTLLELDEAIRCLPQMEAHITQIAYWHWRRTVEIEEEQLRAAADHEAEADGHDDPDDHSHRHHRA